MLVRKIIVSHSELLCVSLSPDIGLDYSISGPLSLTFEDCARRSCTDMNILNDDTLEDLVEVFTVSLETVPGLMDRVSLIPAQTRVLIIDDDGKDYV